VRLVIDIVTVTSPGGMQNNLELAKSAELRCPPDWDVIVLQGPGGFEIEPSDRLRIVTHERPRGWPAMWGWFRDGLPRAAAAQGADVVYSLSGMLTRNVCRSFATVNSINNMLPFTPEHLHYLRPWSAWRLRLEILQRVYVRSSRIADRLVLPSRHGIERLCAYAGDLSGKAFVAMNPVPRHVLYDPSRPPAHPYGGKPFLFYLSVVFWYKNHLNLIEGYRRVLASGEELPDLILAGPPDDRDYVRRIHEAIDRGRLGERVKFLGKIPREDIPGLLHHATVNVFPSTCETNSFVQGEILGAQGVMACSSVPPMPEVAGAAAELFDPYDPDSIGSTLLRLCRDEGRRAELRRLAAARAAEFTRDACGEQMWRAILEARESFRTRASR
jgi:glycosyltransferase involved in cell wall biosynthesis